MHRHSEKGGIIGAFLLILGILVLLAMVSVVAGGLYIAHHVRMSKAASSHGQNVDVETPFGSVHVREDGTIDPKRFGVPVYPGAVLREDHHKLANVELDFGSEGKQVTVVAGEYTTPDSIEKVREFYRDELPHWMVSEDRHGGVKFSFTEGGHKRIVVLKHHGGYTSIALVSVGEPAVN
jgi:hypothetical protein